LLGVIDPQGYVANAIAVQADVLSHFVVWAKRGCEDKTDFALLQDIGGSVPLASLRAGVGYQAEAEGHAVKVGSLARVAYVKLDIIGAVQLKQIFTCLLFVVGKGAHNSTVTPWVAQFYQGRKKDIPLGRSLDRPPKVGLTLCVRSGAHFQTFTN
jgi:hypothetical protein